MSERTIRHQYRDPVELIWIRAAADLGLRVRRSAEVFASYDGAGTLTISDAVHFDPDDSLAQMIFHELCHFLVAGPSARGLLDWGLTNTDGKDLVLEHACHRLQAALATPYGLREFMAVTTEWRPYWDALPVDPLKAGDDPAIALAQAGFARAESAPFEDVLKRSLGATAVIADAVREMASDGSLWRQTRPRHRLGSLLSSAVNERCGDCAWAYGMASSLRCRQHKAAAKAGPRVDPEETACERWESELSERDCGTCGACCHRGFDLVPVAARDPFRRLHPELVQLGSAGYHVPRPAGTCLALTGDGADKTPYRCRYYETRPRNCAEFAVAGDACLVARRRVGLSR